MKTAFHHNLEIKDNKVYAKVDFEPNSVIFEFTGDFYTKDNLPKDTTHTMQIGENLWISASGDIDDYVGHSCNPTAYLYIVGTRVFLKSVFKIINNTEITIDYSLGSNATKEEWKMDCKCSSYFCRKEISGFQYLSKYAQEQYHSLGMVPYYQIKDLNGSKNK